MDGLLVDWLAEWLGCWLSECLANLLTRWIGGSDKTIYNNLLLLLLFISRANRISVCRHDFE